MVVVVVVVVGGSAFVVFVVDSHCTAQKQHRSEI